MMRFDLQTTRKLTVRAVSVSFLILWAVILGCAQPLSLTSQAATLEDGASGKKGREPDSNTPGASKLGAKDSRATKEKASHSQAAPDNHTAEDVPAPSSNRETAAQPNTGDRLAALEEAIRSQNE